MATTLGLVTVRRSYYRCSRCCTSSAPYDEQVGLGGEAVSAEMARAALLLAVHHPFRQAADLLKALTGQSLSSKTIHRLMVRVGQTACEQEDQEAEGMKTWQPCASEVQPPRLYVTTDGVMVRLQEGFKEAKVVTCYGDASPGRPFKRHRVRFESAEPFAAYAWSLACRCGLAKTGETVLLGDGAAWIGEHVGGVLGEHTTHIVDWYHAMQHVWDCGRALYGEGTGQTAAWVKKVENLLWNGEVRKILQRLNDEADEELEAERRKALTGLITYLTNQDARLAYDRFRARGLDIGSGQVESACKNVVAARMKRAGMRWSPRGAQATLSLRALYMSDQWERFWCRKPLAA